MEPEDTSLLAALADCFEKNECLGGWFMRQLPLADAPAAARKYREFRAELVRWKGPPLAEDEGPDWQRADWGEIRMKRAYDNANR